MTFLWNNLVNLVNVLTGEFWDAAASNGILIRSRWMRSDCRCLRHWFYWSKCTKFRWGRPHREWSLFEFR